jgi:minor extracellular serine protease Vpr
MRRSLFASSALAAGLFIACGGLGNAASAQHGTRAANSAADLQQLLIKGGARQALIDARLTGRTGPVDIWVALSDPALATYKSLRLEQLGASMQPRRSTRQAQVTAQSSTLAAETAVQGELRSHRALLLEKQSAAMNSLQGLGARELGRVHVAHNAIAVTVDASALPAIRQLPGVTTVRPVVNYRLTLEETVPYVGATAVHDRGIEGDGVVVAVLDSGVDYTHRNLGGPGTTAAYAAAYGDAPGDPENETRDGLFPTEKVIEGFDFVGEAWPDGDRTEDPDPIDAPGAPVAMGGHGTHVADIVAGKTDDGLHKGVAPEASLLAVKVCSAVSTSCSGVALLRGMDFALDPNGDGDISDAADVINMSLGSDYGQEEDDLAEASAAAVRLGVVVVTAAGNAADRPYIVSSPSIGAGVISVAQTQVPSARAFPLIVNSPEEIATTDPNTATVSWAPIGGGFSGDVAYVGQGCPAGSIAPNSPEDPYLDDPAGKVALIDRGGCSVSLKVDRAAEAGAIGVLIGLIAPGDAISFSFGGGDDFVPTLVITQARSNSIKAHLEAPVNVTVSPESAIDLVGGMVTSSARGPTISHSAIKPEIGAPGGSVSAVSATGDGEEAFSGTSGATPMVSGAAALLIEAYPKRTPEQIKAMLMNSAETEIFTNPALLPGELAPISRIGAGELRVDRALDLSSVARDREGHSAALSFGFHDVVAFKTLRRRLLVENFADTDKTFNITTTFRYSADEATDAVRVIAPDRVHVRAHGRREIHVIMIIDGRKLPDWSLDGGANGGTGSLLNTPEYDGYLQLTAGDERLTVPWHVLPRKAAAIVASDHDVSVGESVRLINLGLARSGLDVFSLTGVSPRADESELPGPGDSFAFIDLRAVGVRLVTPGVLQFAVNTYGRRAHPNYPAEFDVVIDTNRDGAPDFVVFNAELGGFAVTGQNVVFVGNLTTQVATAVAFADADLQSGNVILTVPTLAIGITDDTTIDFEVAAFDNYFTGEQTDAIDAMTYTPSLPKFIAVNPPEVVRPHSTVRIRTAGVPGGAEASPSQIGLLLMHRLDARREATIVRMQ